MKLIDWLPGLTLEQDPDAVEDYEMDFTAWLDGEASVLASETHQNCMAAVIGNVDANIVKFRVSQVERDAFVTIRVESPSGRANNFTTFFNPVEQ